MERGDQALGRRAVVAPAPRRGRFAMAWFPFRRSRTLTVPLGRPVHQRVPRLTSSRRGNCERAHAHRRRPVTSRRVGSVGGSRHLARGVAVVCHARPSGWSDRSIARTRARRGHGSRARHRIRARRPSGERSSCRLGCGPTRGAAFRCGSAGDGRVVPSGNPAFLTPGAELPRTSRLPDTGHTTSAHARSPVRRGRRPPGAVHRPRDHDSGGRHDAVARTRLRPAPAFAGPGCRDLRCSVDRPQFDAGRCCNRIRLRLPIPHRRSRPLRISDPVCRSTPLRSPSARLDPSGRSAPAEPPFRRSRDCGARLGFTIRRWDVMGCKRIVVGSAARSARVNDHCAAGHLARPSPIQPHVAERDCSRHTATGELPLRTRAARRQAFADRPAAGSMPSAPVVLSRRRPRRLRVCTG